MTDPEWCEDCTRYGHNRFSCLYTHNGWDIDEEKDEI